MLVSFVYVVVCRLFALMLLLTRSDHSMELEILVLRQELAILRRQARRPQLTHADRLVLAVFSRVLPRRSWHAFFVTPQTLLRWHRQLVGPPLDVPAQAAGPAICRRRGTAADPSAHARERSLGLRPDRRRAAQARDQRFSDAGAERARARRYPAGAGARRAELALVPPRAR